MCPRCDFDFGALGSHNEAGHGTLFCARCQVGVIFADSPDPAVTLICPVLLIVAISTSIKSFAFFRPTVRMRNRGPWDTCNSLLSVIGALSHVESQASQINYWITALVAYRTLYRLQQIIV